MRHDNVAAIITTELEKASYKVPENSIKTTTATLTWREIWAKKSAEDLAKMRMSKLALKGITIRVLKGSQMNFARFNQMTTMYRGRPHLRMSSWGPP
ncbi:hypothetical protein PUN28_017808 [Cardiocondyla obscurior]|uniref:Uncharacterized protein n=1 Tax=Cardiocondyla obscurior TaxID=286306 RepID=A0AAW2ENG6_9HYME